VHADFIAGLGQFSLFYNQKCMRKCNRKYSCICQIFGLL